jgi:hypothetical protein
MTEEIENVNMKSATSIKYEIRDAKIEGTPKSN